MENFQKGSGKAVLLGSSKGLTVRMVMTFAVLGFLYVAFLTFISSYFGLGIVPLIFIAGFMIMIQWYFSDRIVLWSTGAKIVTNEEYPELHEIVENLVAKAKLPKPKIAVIETEIPNAFATGKSQKSSVVAVTTGLMRILEKEELEGVIAHELTHVKNRDVTVITLASLFSTVAWFVMNHTTRTNYDDDEGGSALLFIVPLIVWFLSSLIIRAISRYRELYADRGAAFMTDKPLELCNALRKISGKIEVMPKSELNKVEGMNAFFIIPAVSEFVGNLFSTHPTLEARVKQLIEIEHFINPNNPVLENESSKKIFMVDDPLKGLSRGKIKALRRLEEYELPSVVREKLKQKFPFNTMSEQEINECFIEFKKFIWILFMSRGTKRRIAMTNLIIDEVWHTLIQCTEEYQEFCNILGGEYIHHKPSTKTESFGHDTVLNFQQDYEKYFGELRPIWKYSVQESIVTDERNLMIKRYELAKTSELVQSSKRGPVCSSFSYASSCGSSSCGGSCSNVSYEGSGDSGCGGGGCGSSSCGGGCGGCGGCGG